MSQESPILKVLDEGKVETAGDTDYAFLEEQIADARAWPTDEEVMAKLPNIASRATSVSQASRRTGRHREEAAD